MKNAILNTIEKSNNKDYTFFEDFKQIIIDKVADYGKDKKALKSFFEDMQKGGCISGMIGDFIYHADCKNFYIKHIEDLEELKSILEEETGAQIPNRHNLPHYTFLAWLAFEEFCYDIYRNEFEK
jgi:hypothetical protein